MTRLLVTGAAGFIGSHVCEALVARGEDVIGVDNFDPFYARAVKERNLEGLRRGPRFRFLEADVARDPLPWDGVDGAIHLAARPGVRPSLEDPAGYVTANVGGTARGLDGARRAGVARVILGSSSSVYGDTTPAPFPEDAAAVEPISPYAATKRASELLAYAFAQLYRGRRAGAARPADRPDRADPGPGAAGGALPRPARGRAAHRRRPAPRRGGARLPAARRDRGRDPALRPLVRGDPWTSVLSISSSRPASGFSCRTTTARSTCSRKSSRRAARSPTPITCWACRTRWWVSKTRPWHGSTARCS